jgi:hypothetical protein
MVSLHPPVNLANNIKEAISDKNWKAAMDAKYLALVNNKTWHIVPPKKKGMLYL